MDVRATGQDPPGDERPRVAVVIPCYRVVREVGAVLRKIGPEVHRIYCVDDACPEGSGDHVERTVDDPRVQVLRHEVNEGVGGATLTGFREARADGATILVKLDGDGQMDPALLPRFLAPLLAGRADYAKGNRFYDPGSVRGMPLIRLLGNAVLSFVTKLASGYWNVFDPTNGYVALHGAVFDRLPLERISRGYFFESDLLFRLNTVQAVVEDVPMDAVYGDERSGLAPARIGGEFLVKNARNTVLRLLYGYYLRDFGAGSLELLLGSVLLGFGVVFGANRWMYSESTGTPVTAGTVMLAGLPVMLGLQLLLSFLAGDRRRLPVVPLHRRLLG